MRTSPGYSITVRVEVDPSKHTSSSLATTVTSAGGELTALDVVDSTTNLMVIDLTCNARDVDHSEEIVHALDEVEGAHVKKVSDRTFLLHLGGKIEVHSKVALKTRDDLSRAYTPGVARVCLAIAEDKSNARSLTIKRNTVAVVTDGSAVLGLGNIGPEAALPVMEGKAALFKRFADIDAWPVCLDTQDTDEIISIVKAIAPVYGGINLEDISAPRCFEIERRLREILDIPVFHDDQHGTAIVVLAALMNSLRLVKKDKSKIRLIMCGAGAAGTAIAKLLAKFGIENIICFDVKGAVHQGRSDKESLSEWVLESTNPNQFKGTLSEAMKNADVFIGVSAPNVLTESDVASMAKNSIVFALANPDPEIDPSIALKHAKVVATGRSDYPNQINNVLAFPGVFRGLLNAQSKRITDEVLIAAAIAIASCVHENQINEAFIVPSVFDPNVTKSVAEAVAKTSV